MRLTIQPVGAFDIEHIIYIFYQHSSPIGARKI